MTVEEIVNLAVKWGPTIIVLLIILWSSFIGARRGLRKSTILFVHAIIAGSLSVAFLLFASRSKTADKLILDVANMVLGSDTGLQDLLGASSDCTTFRQTLIDGLPSMLAGNGQLTIMIQENSSYILTIVELLTSIVFSIISIILYFILIFILYIAYVLFYSNKKYKKKLDKKIVYGQVEHTYKKRRMAGALVGATRGMVVSLLFLSCLGSLLFVVTGGTGEETMDDIEFGDSTVDMIYDIYSGVSEYGNYGVYKVLNIFKDNENTPFYLYAVDLVFSGRLVDENAGIDENIVFREEVGELVGFTKELVQLLAKYYDGDLMTLINSLDMDEILNLLSDDNFQKDFDLLIDEFKTPQFLSHFVFSLVETYLGNMSNPDFSTGMDPMITEVVSLLFEDGYLCESIPYEKQLLEEMQLSKDYTNSKYQLDTLHLEDIITKHNVKIIYKMFTDIMSVSNIEDLNDEEMIDFIESIVDGIVELSIFNPDYNDVFNGVYRRLFAYIDAELLNLGEPSEIEYDLSTSYYMDKAYDDVKWIEEIDKLINVIKDGSTLFVNLKDADGLITATSLFSIYDKNDPNYNANVRAFESLFSSISSSRILSMIFSSNMMIGGIEDILVSLIPGYQIPEKINYYDTYNDNGTIKEYGELHHILEALKILISNENINHVVLDLLYQDEELSFDSLNGLITALKGEGGILDTLLNSRIMCSIFSSFILNMSFEDSGFEIYVHNSLLERDDEGHYIDIINQEDLKLFLFELVDVYDLISPLMEEEFEFSDVSSLLSDPIILEVLESKIIEGTLSKLLINNIQDIEFLVIPQAMLDGSNLISFNNHDSEIKTLIKVLQKTGIDLGALLEGSEDSEVVLSLEEQTENPMLSAIKDLSEDDITLLFESQILYYTISNILEKDIENIVQNFVVIIPETAKNKLVNDSLEYLIKKDILIDFLVNVLELLPEGDEFNVNDIIGNLLVNIDSYINNSIIAPTLVHYLVSSDEFDSLSIPQILLNDGTYESLLVYRPNNLWRTELKSLLHALDELFDVSGGNEIIFDENTISDKLEFIIQNYNQPSNLDQNFTKLDLIYESLIVSSNITKVLYEDILTPEADLIKEELKYANEVYDSNYKIIRKDEIKKLVHATNVLGISLTNDELDIKTYITNISDLNKSEREELYDSYLLLGIITNAVDTIILNSDGTLETISLAYENNQLIKTSEIDAILELFDGDLLTKLVDGTDGFDFNEFSIHKLRNVIYDESTDRTKSYLVLNSVSKIISELNGIYIPKNDYYVIRSTGEGFIKANSLAKMIDGVEALGFTTVDVDFESFAFPHPDDLEIISESDILRASITKMIKVTSDTRNIVVAVEDNDLYRIVTQDYNDQALVYLTKDEFKTMILGIEYIFDIDDTQVTSKDYEFKVDLNTLTQIAKLPEEQRNTIIKSSVLRSVVNSFFIEGISINLGFGKITLNYEAAGLSVSNETCYNLLTEQKFVTKFATEQQIHMILDRLHYLQ